MTDVVLVAAAVLILGYVAFTVAAAIRSRRR